MSVSYPQAVEYELKSKIYLCNRRRDGCLYRFIKSRQGQPKICIKCLESMGLLELYELIETSHSWPAR